MTDALIFRDPPKRTERESEVLAELVDHPNRWALVAQDALPAARRRWEDARRKVGADGEFKVRQVSCGPDTALVDLYVRYTPEVDA